MEETLLPAIGPQPIDPTLVVQDKPTTGLLGDTKLDKPTKDTVGQFKDWATRMPEPGERSLFGEPEILRPVTQAIHGAAQILPGNTTEALIDVALGAGNAAYKGLRVMGIPDFMAKVGRTALPGATGAASEAVQGRDAEKGAATAVISQMFGATIGKIFGGRESITGSFFEKLGTANNTKLHNRITNFLSPELADRASKDLPSLKNQLGGIDGLKELVIPSKGTREIGTMLDTAEAAVKKKFSKGTFNIPEDAYRIARGEVLPETSSLISVNIKDLVDYRRILRDRQRDLMKKEGTTNVTVALKPQGTLVNPGQPPPDSIRTVDIAKLADDVEGRLKDALKKDARLSKTFTQALDDYGKTIDLREALLPDYNKIFPSYPKVSSSTFDPVALYSSMTKHSDTITHERFPEMYRLFEGNTRGVGPRWENLSFPAKRLSGGSTVRLAENIPTINYLSLPKHMREVVFPNAANQTVAGAAASNLRTSTAQAAVPAVGAAMGMGSENPNPIETLMGLFGRKQQ